ncbi:MAG TPA: HD domain-containing phosphohydrolase [Actinomycetota bacterium]
MGHRLTNHQASPTHVRRDGGGHPDGLAGGHLPVGARIIAVGDAFTAMISPAPRRTVPEAVAELRRGGARSAPAASRRAGPRS